MQTVVVGDLSGLQSFLFTLTPGEGGQARRLRARSFFIQVLAECCALKFRAALGWPRETLVFCGAAKFVLIADATADLASLPEVACGINRWLLAEAGGQLNFAWAAETGAETESVLWNRAMRALQHRKLSAWADAAQANGAWDSRLLALPPVSLDSHNRPQVPMPSVFNDEAVGGKLPQQNWLELRSDHARADFSILGCAGKLHRDYPHDATGRLAVFSLGPAASPPQQPPPETRWLARHIPTDANRAPLTFEHLAQRARGDRLLGVLKMDVDSLGAAFERVQQAGGPGAVQTLSHRLDHFFSKTLDEQLTHHADSGWELLYTVFSGGDDLLVVAPWDIAFRYAAEVQRRFRETFRADRLTISAGLALCKPKFPIQRAVEYAGEMLERAKTQGKDRYAAFGQVWEWRDHGLIDAAVLELLGIADTDGRKFPRAWLEETLAIAEAAAGSGRFEVEAPGLSEAEQTARRNARQLASARLAYQAKRKYSRGFRAYIARLLPDFDDRSLPSIRYLPAILRCSITALRQPRD